MEVLTIWGDIRVCVKGSLRARASCFDCDGSVVVVAFVVSDVETVGFSVGGLLDCVHVRYLNDSWL